MEWLKNVGLLDLEHKGLSTENRWIFIQVSIYEQHGKHKPKINNRYTKNKEKITNKTLKKSITEPQGREKKEKDRNREGTVKKSRKQLTKWQ